MPAQARRRSVRRRLPTLVACIPDAWERFAWTSHGHGRFASHDAAASRAGPGVPPGWQPSHPALLADLRQAGYFAG